MPTLILSPRYTADSRLVRAAAERAGWQVVRLPGWRVPDWLPRQDLAFYGAPLFADVVAGDLGIELLQPAPDWPATLPPALLDREVRYAGLDQARTLAAPRFVKPALDQCFQHDGRRIVALRDLRRARPAIDEIIRDALPERVAGVAAARQELSLNWTALRDVGRQIRHLDDRIEGDEALIAALCAITSVVADVRRSPVVPGRSAATQPLGRPSNTVSMTSSSGKTCPAI